MRTCLLLCVCLLAGCSGKPTLTAEEASGKALKLRGQTVRVRGDFFDATPLGDVIHLYLGPRASRVECLFPRSAGPELAGLHGEIVVEGVAEHDSGRLTLRKARLVSP